jgi:hypothetical protein
VARHAREGADVIRSFGLYTAANVLAMSWTLFAVTRESVFTVSDDAQLELLVLTVPLALLAATAVTVVVAWALPEARRDAFLRRHFAIYLVTPVLLFLLSRGGDITTQHLGAVYILAIAAWTAHALEGLWHVVANMSDRRAALTLAAVLLVPYFALARYDTTGPTQTDEPLFLLLVAAALAAQLYLACRDLRVAHRPALIGVALACLTHPILSYTSQIYPELLAALALVSAARFVRAGRSASPLALAGAAIGFAVFVVFGALSFILTSDLQPALTFAPQVGTLGLLFDRTFGLIPRAPIYLVAALGVIPLWRRGPSASFVTLFVGWVASFMFAASIGSWWAEGSPPSRYILIGLPFFVVLLAAGLEQLASLRAPAWRAVGAGLASFSLFIAYVFAVLPGLRYDVAADIRLTDRNGQLFEFVGRLARPDPAVAFPSIVRGTPLDFALGIAWLALVIALLRFGRDAPHPRNGRTRLHRQASRP